MCLFKVFLNIGHQNSPPCLTWPSASSPKDEECPVGPVSYLQVLVAVSGITGHLKWHWTLVFMQLNSVAKYVKGKFMNLAFHFSLDVYTAETPFGRFVGVFLIMKKIIYTD